MARPVALFANDHCTILLVVGLDWDDQQRSKLPKVWDLIVLRQGLDLAAMFQDVLTMLAVQFCADRGDQPTQAHTLIWRQIEVDSPAGYAPGRVALAHR